ncbi:LysR family transcriptional regulator ArgP [Pseudorhodobacter aquimaris]|uniref:LysR family transcriptional regulator ArgP n=1 Tax=Pseudorhodobacter aquimaris TaxID=687412 RepID=UPI00067C979B|nr:LysR family transcriptional regulator ArgP [Pseudorhodobacter aquimaris]
MLDYAQLAALAAVHRRGSFDLAAASLSLTPSAISQRLKSLEERMGTLLIRRGQPCVATAAGLRLIQHFEDVMLLEAALTEGLPAQNPATIRIAVNADSLATWVLPALAQVEGMLFDLVIDDQDHSQGLLRAGEVSAAITSHAGPLQGCDTVALGALRYRATASPAFMDRWMAEGAGRAALARAPALTFSDKDRLQRDWIAAQFGTGAGFAFPTHRIASSQGFVEAALLGLGWGMNPEPLVVPHLEAGRLVELVADSALDVPLYWQFARLTGPAIAPLTAAITRSAALALR